MFVDTHQLYLYTNSLHQLSQSSTHMGQLLQDTNLYFLQTNMHVNLLQQKYLELQDAIYDVTKYFNDILGKIESVEEKINISATLLTTFQSYRPTAFNVQEDTFKFQHRFHTTLSLNRSIKDYVNNGICAGVFAGFDAYTLRAQKNMKYLQMSANVSIGKAKASLDAKGLLYDDDTFMPSLALQGSLHAALAEIGVKAHVGGNYLYADGEAKAGVGVVRAEAKAIINKEEISLKAEMGAAAVRGEVKGSISIFGIKITASASGDIGSIGANVEFSKKKGEFEIGSHCSFLAGVGLKIKVNY